jgi:hypothetical protein
MRALTDAELDVVSGGKRKNKWVIAHNQVVLAKQSNEQEIEDVDIKIVKSTNVTVTVGSQSNSISLSQA